jgi:hypothetical protein
MSHSTKFPFSFSFVIRFPQREQNVSIDTRTERAGERVKNHFSHNNTNQPAAVKKKLFQNQHFRSSSSEILCRRSSLQFSIFTQLHWIKKIVRSRINAFGAW